MESYASCWQCQRQFASDQVLAYRNGWVCGTCKPVFFQKIQEGLTPKLRQGLEIAGFVPRAFAKIIDLLITTTFNWGVTFLLFFAMRRGMGSSTSMAFESAVLVLNSVSGLILPCIYETFMVGRYQATLGKMLLGLKVVRSDGERLTFLRAFGRYWGTALSGIACLFGYIVAAFDEETRALHDFLADTRVIYSDVNFTGMGE